MSRENLISVDDLSVHFDVGRGNISLTRGAKVRAVDGLSFTVARGETLGLVGESGCGKSTAGRATVHLQRPTGGRVVFDGVDLGELSERQLRHMRKRMQMVYQDPYASLNPRMRVRDIVGDPLAVHRLAKGKAREDRIVELLEMVGLDASHLDRYPHEFSGGQRQRVGIARALAVEPDFIVFDESIAALDVSIQAQIINLLRDLQRKKNLTYLFISHDMAVIRHVSDRVAVMYLGEIVEIGRTEEIFTDARHPYTKALLKSAPIPMVAAGKKPTLEGIEGEPPSPLDAPVGCRFFKRCPVSRTECEARRQSLQMTSRGHLVACRFAGAPPPAGAA